jgi:hypothetical protein
MLRGVVGEKEPDKKPLISEAGDVIKAVGGIVGGIAAVAGAAAAIGTVGAVAAAGAVGVAAVGYVFWRRNKSETTSGRAAGGGSATVGPLSLQQKYDRFIEELISLKKDLVVPTLQLSTASSKADLKKAESSYYSWQVKCEKVVKKWLGPGAGEKFMKGVIAPAYDKKKARYVSPAAQFTAYELEQLFKKEETSKLFVKALNDLIDKVPSMTEADLRNPS